MYETRFKCSANVQPRNRPALSESTGRRQEAGGRGRRQKRCDGISSSLLPPAFCLLPSDFGVGEPARVMLAGGGLPLMDNKGAKAVIRDAGDGFFIGITPSGHAQALETDAGRAGAARPTALLLVALGSCTAVDVITILRKKRERVTDYRVDVSGTRRDEHPRAYTRMELRHIA